MHAKYSDYQLVLKLSPGIQLEILRDAFVDVEGTTVFPSA